MNSLLAQFGENTFSSFRVRNYRLYYIGQVISTSGTFMQSVAQAWLVLQLTNSGTALGLVTALQCLPVLVVAPFGGTIADRFSKRKLLMITQTAFGIIALVLGMLVLTGLVQLWMVCVFAVIYGVINAIDNPTRQSFLVEMVGEDKLRNAVTLYSCLVNSARVIGPAIAGVIIVMVSLAPCFIFNGLSYAAVIVMLMLIRTDELHALPDAAPKGGQIREGFRYVASTPVVRNILIMMAIIGTLTFEFQVSLPLLAQFSFHGDAESYAALTGAMGLGAVIGGLFVASQNKVSPPMLIRAAALFGLAVLFAAMMPALLLAVLAMVCVGIFSISFTSLGNSVLQLECDPRMRGRVMAFWAIAFLGSTAIGGPIVGWIGEHTEPHYALGIGGVAALVAAALGYMTLRNAPSRQNAQPAIARKAESPAE